MTRLPLLPALLAAGSLLLVPGAARAHGIQSSLERFGGLGAQLQTSFSNGLPASDADVRLVPPGGGAPIAMGHTDSQGRLSFRLPPQANADWEIQVIAGPGHRDYLEVPAATGDKGPRISSSEGPLRGPLSQLLAVGAIGISGLLGGLLMRRPRA
jgi:nickel transport protein